MWDGPGRLADERGPTWARCFAAIHHVVVIGAAPESNRWRASQGAVRGPERSYRRQVLAQPLEPTDVARVSHVKVGRVASVSPVDRERPRGRSTRYGGVSPPSRCKHRFRRSSLYRCALGHSSRTL